MSQWMYITMGRNVDVKVLNFSGYVSSQFPQAGKEYDLLLREAEDYAWS